VVQQGKKFSLNKDEQKFASVVKKEKIAEDGEYNLSANRYADSERGFELNGAWKMVELGEVCEIMNGYAFKSGNYTDSGIRIIRITNVQKGKIVDDNSKFYTLKTKEPVEKYKLFENDLLISLTGNVGRIGLLPANFLPAVLNQRVACLRINEDKINKHFLFHLLNTDNFEKDCIKSSNGIAQKNLSTIWLSKYQIPLPPIEVQQQIVAELDGYQKIIDGAKQIVENYKPTIKIDPKWKMVELDEVLDYEQPTKYIVRSVDYNDQYPIPVLTAGKTFILGYTNEEEGIFKENLPVIIFDDFTTASKFVDFPFKVKSSAMKILHAKKDKADIRFLYYVIQKIKFTNDKHKRYWISEYSKIKIPLPPIEVQQQIVAKIEEEQKIVEANKELIKIFEQKIKDKISELWGK